MKKIEQLAFQGDVAFRRVTAVPPGAVEQRVGDEIIAAHSETGHHHVALGADALYEMPGGMLAYMVSEQPIRIEHRRSWDTHEPLELLADGETVWEIRRQREYTPHGWRKVMD